MTAHGSGEPTTNRFGQTRFVDTNEGEEALTRIFNWPQDFNNPALGHCPVIFLGHSLDNHIRILRRSLNFNASGFNTVVKTIDTQRLARALHIPSSNKISLGSLCEYNGFEFANPHTACNDAAYTLINAVIMALGDESPGTQKSVQEVVDSISHYSRTQLNATLGVPLFCVRCEGYDHIHNNPDCCTVSIPHCERCHAVGRSGRRLAKSHMTHRCRRPSV